MNILVFQLIMVGLAAMVHWDLDKIQNFCTTVEPLVHVAQVSQDQIDKILFDFELPQYPIMPELPYRSAALYSQLPAMEPELTDEFDELATSVTQTEAQFTHTIELI